MNYLKNVRKEMKQVEWPSSRETSKYTLTVIFSIIIFALYFALTDTGSLWLINWLVGLVN